MCAAGRTGAFNAVGNKHTAGGAGGSGGGGGAQGPLPCRSILVDCPRDGATARRQDGSDQTDAAAVLICRADWSQQHLGSFSPQFLVKQWCPGCNKCPVAKNVRFPDDEPHSPVPAGNVRRPTFGEVLDSSTALVRERISICYCLCSRFHCLSLFLHCLLLYSLRLQCLKL